MGGCWIRQKKRMCLTPGICPISNPQIANRLAGTKEPMYKSMRTRLAVLEGQRQAQSNTEAKRVLRAFLYCYPQERWELRVAISKKIIYGAASLTDAEQAACDHLHEIADCLRFGLPLPPPRRAFTLGAP